jgi:hypothetical protein
LEVKKIRLRMTSILNLTAGQLRKAARIKEKLDELGQELNRLLGDGGGKATGKRRISAAGIARIRAGVKARWAKIRAANGGKVPKRKMSAAAKAKLAAIARARWKAAKAKGKKAL